MGLKRTRGGRFCRREKKGTLAGGVTGKLIGGLSDAESRAGRATKKRVVPSESDRGAEKQTSYCNKLQINGKTK